MQRGQRLVAGGPVAEAVRELGCPGVFASPSSRVRTAWPTRITGWVAPAAMPGSSRGHHSARTSCQGRPAVSRSKYVVQSAILRGSPRASCQFSAVTRAAGAGMSSSLWL